MVAVSVVLSTYNDAYFLRKTLDSVLTQEMEDLELIVVNDGSSDQRVVEILCEYREKDERVQVISKDNEGLTHALIDGCSLARSDYVARIDVGDAMLPGRLKKQTEVMEQNPDCVFVSCWTEICGPDWEPMWTAKGEPSLDVPVSVLPDNPQDGLTGDVPHHGSVMFRKSAYKEVGGYRAAFYYGQDWDLWYRLAEFGSFQVVQETLYRARFFPNSISMMRKQQQDEISLCSKAAFVARQRDEEENHWLDKASLIRPGQVSQAEEKFQDFEPGFYFIGEVLRRRGDARCRNYLSEAMRQSPAKPRAYLRWIQSLFLPSGKAA